MPRRPWNATGAGLAAVVLLGGCGSGGPAPIEPAGPSPSPWSAGPAAEVSVPQEIGRRPDIAVADEQARALIARVGDIVRREGGITQALHETEMSAAACDEAPRVAGLERRSYLAKLTESLDEPRWTAVQKAVRAEAARLGYTHVRPLADVPGQHDIDYVDPATNASVSVGTGQQGTYVAVDTACHPKRVGAASIP